MHGNITSIFPTEPTKPVAPKTRTITLTNRAPLKIVEDEWPVIAQGVCSSEPETCEDWVIEIRVRHQLWTDTAFGKIGGQYLIHANYNYSFDPMEQYQRIRVGRLLTAHHAAENLWKEIFAVGEELRGRIFNKALREQVTHAVDACFADLPAQTA